MATLDLKKQQLKHLYQATTARVEAVDVPPLYVLSIDGEGRPKSQNYLEAVAVLFSVSYTIKFLLKKQDVQLDYTVMPLEGLWWTKDSTSWHLATDENCLWKAMIVQPAFVADEVVEQAKRDVQKKKPSVLLSQVTFELFHEGWVAQLLHIGLYADEDRSLTQMYEWIQAQGGHLRGKHHEIYLSDPNRTDPERLRTILRQPFA